MFFLQRVSSRAQCPRPARRLLPGRSARTLSIGGVGQVSRISYAMPHRKSPRSPRCQRGKTRAEARASERAPIAVLCDSRIAGCRPASQPPQSTAWPGICRSPWAAPWRASGRAGTNAARPPSDAARWLLSGCARFDHVQRCETCWALFKSGLGSCVVCGAGGACALCLLTPLQFPSWPRKERGAPSHAAAQRTHAQRSPW